MTKFVPFDGFEKPSTLGKTLDSSMQENCNDRLAPDVPVPCSAKPCPPYWQTTGELDCLSNGLVDREEKDGCGNTRWVRTTDKVIWVDTTETVCVSALDASERIYMQQTNQCGETRKVDTGKKCCYPSWIQSAPQVQNCDQSMYRLQEENGCGETRLVSTGLPVAFVDNGQRRCQDTLYQGQEVNQCGVLQWKTLGPYVWADTGLTRCVGSLIEKEQANQCGTLRWINTNASLDWTDTGTVSCVGTYTVQQADQCGNTRTDDRGAIIWTNTGIEQCGPVSLNVEKEQINQCGNLRWYNTGVACTAVVAAMPASFGGACYVQPEGDVVSTYVINFGSNGTGSQTKFSNDGTVPFGWAPSTVDGAKYEIKVDYTFSGPNASYSGPANGVWVSMSAGAYLEFRISGPGSSGAYASGTIAIRRVGQTVADTTSTIESSFISIGVACP